MIGLAYAMTGEIESILKTTDAKLLETVSGVPSMRWRRVSWPLPAGWER